MTGIDVVKDILALSVHAPSGDNAQPWRFRLTNSAVALFNAPESDATLYNYKQRGSYLSHGAVIENCVIAAEARGLHATVVYLPANGAVAEITFTEAPVRTDELHACIEKRVTNRKPYTKRPLDAAHARALLDASLSRGFKLRLVEARGALSALAQVLSLNERLLMENRQLHDFLFGMIRWTPKEERERPGLYVLTMEFPLPIRLLLKHVVASWEWTLRLNKLGLSRAIPKQTTELNRASSALGAIIIEDLRDESFIKAGRALQRVWLTAQHLGLSVQPVTALPYLGQRVEAGETESLSSEHVKSIAEANTAIAAAFGLKGTERIAMLFRVGYGPKPSAHSAKRAPVFI